MVPGSLAVPSYHCCHRLNGAASTAWQGHGNPCMHRRRPVHPFTRLFASGFFLQCQCNAKHFSTPTKQPIYCYAPQVTEDWVKPGAVVLDVGINVREPASKDHKHRLVGDVHFAQVSKVASAISPVPGGAHLLTSSVMFHSALQAALSCSTGCSAGPCSMAADLNTTARLAQPVLTCNTHMIRRCRPHDDRCFVAQHPRGGQAARGHLEAAVMSEIQESILCCVYVDCGAIQHCKSDCDFAAPCA